jgi:hypothetical protein
MGPKPMPKPVLYSVGFQTHHAITPESPEAPTAEWLSSGGGSSGTVSLYVANEGNAELTKAKLT